MNKKLVIVSLLLSLAVTNIVPTQPGFAIEMTWPLSSLFFVLQQNMLTTMQKAIHNAGGWGHNPYWASGDDGPKSMTGTPQCHGYFATTDPFDFVLQAGVNIQVGFRANNGPYASPIFYFSDILRQQRNCVGQCAYGAQLYNTYGYWAFNNSSPQSSLGPSNSVTRGQPSQSQGTTVDDAFRWALGVGDGMQLMQYFGIVNAQGITIDPNNLTTLFSDNTNTYYFAQTGVMIYLPLHMISPGDDLAKADPDYLNFGPAPGTPAYNTPITTDPAQRTILPWTYGYMPRNIPAQLTGQPEATTPGTVNQIDF